MSPRHTGPPGQRDTGLGVSAGQAPSSNLFLGLGGLRDPEKLWGAVQVLAPGQPRFPVPAYSGKVRPE